MALDVSTRMRRARPLTACSLVPAAGGAEILDKQLRRNQLLQLRRNS